MLKPFHDLAFSQRKWDGNMAEFHPTPETCLSLPYRFRSLGHSTPSQLYKETSFIMLVLAGARCMYYFVSLFLVSVLHSKHSPQNYL